MAILVTCCFRASRAGTVISVVNRGPCSLPPGWRSQGRAKLELPLVSGSEKKRPFRARFAALRAARATPSRGSERVTGAGGPCVGALGSLRVVGIETTALSAT